LRDELGDALVEIGNADLRAGLETVNEQLNRTLTSLAALVEGAPEQDEAVVDEVVSAIKSETEAAVEPFRAEVEELGRQLGEALGSEDQLGGVLTELTEEVQRLRRRLPVRSGSPGLDDEQLQAIVGAVVAALPEAEAAGAAVRFPIDEEPDEEPLRRARAAPGRSRPVVKAEKASTAQRASKASKTSKTGKATKAAKATRARKARGTR